MFIFQWEICRGVKNARETEEGGTEGGREAPHLPHQADQSEAEQAGEAGEGQAAELYPSLHTQPGQEGPAGEYNHALATLRAGGQRSVSPAFFLFRTSLKQIFKNS